MAYVLGQYNKNKNVADDSTFMTLVTNGTPKRRNSQSSAGVESSGVNFTDECIQIPSLLTVNTNYYFHAKIKRMMSSQTFYIKLVNYNSTEVEQYIKTISIGGGDPHDWVDVEFMFTPFASFDCILFELQRTNSDYSEEVRYPIIIYQELSIINNIIPRKIASDVELIKIGVQSPYGLTMCINGEGIKISRSGIYELKNGMITVTFFSVVNAAIEKTSKLEEIETEINTLWDAADALPTAAERQAAKASIGSRSILDKSKDRIIDSFTLDYVYREE